MGNKDKNKIRMFILSLAALLGCNSSYQPLEVVSHIDISRYTGKWYEIASFPQSFQKGCNCTTAEYSLTDKGYIKVINSCRKNSVSSEPTTIQGKAFIADTITNAKLKVQFFWPFKGDYWIIDIDENYSYAVVGHPNREYLWILSRTPAMDDNVYNAILERIKQKGFDITKLQKTNQKCT